MVPELLCTQESGRAAASALLRPPTGAVTRDDQVRVQVAEGGHGRTDDRFERPATQVKAPDERAESIDAGETQGVANDVDNAGMAAPGHHDQTLAADMDHESLIIDDLGVVVPVIAVPGLMGRRHAPLELGGAIHLPGYQDGSGRPAGMDGGVRSPRSPRGPRAGCGQAGQLERFGAGQGDSAAGPDGGMNGERKPLAAARPGQAGEAPGVIEMSVTQHDALKVSEVDTEAFGVDRHSLRGHAGVEQAASSWWWPGGR